MAILEPLSRSQESELWSPRWKCYCCHDSGIVMGAVNIRELVGQHPYGYGIRCNRPGCRAGAELLGLDNRAPAEVCEFFHERGVEEWRSWLLDRQSTARQAREMVERFAEAL